MIPLCGMLSHPTLLFCPRLWIQAQLPPHAWYPGHPSQAHLHAAALQGGRRFRYFKSLKAFQVAVSWQKRWRHPNYTHTQLSPGMPKKYCCLISSAKRCATCKAAEQTAWARAGTTWLPNKELLEERHPRANVSSGSNPQLRLPPEMCS